MREISNTYGAIEKQLQDEGFDVKHLMRDFRGDWGDDGGFIVSISEKNSKIYLHIIGVNYNVSTNSNVLDETDHRIVDGSSLETDIQDYIICSSIEDAQDKINKFVIDLVELIRLQEDEEDYSFETGYVEDYEAVSDYFKNMEKYYLNMLAACWFPFSEYTHVDKEVLLNLTNTTYTPDYTDDDNDDE